MSRYAESLTDWADLHGETPEPVSPPVHTCPRHGTYTPHSLVDADCPQCDRDDYVARRDAHFDYLNDR